LVRNGFQFGGTDALDLWTDRFYRPVPQMGIEETENPQAGNTTRPSSVPPCSPTPFARELENETAVKSEGGECSQSHLNDIVSQIAAEPGKDYMQDI